MDRAAILALNNASAVETSLLTAERLNALLGMAFHVGLADEGRAAVLVAFDQTAAYDSPNFATVRRRYGRFAYVDRVVVAAGCRGRGLPGASTRTSLASHASPDYPSSPAR